MARVSTGKNARSGSSSLSRKDDRRNCTVTSPYDVDTGRVYSTTRCHVSPKSFS